MAVSLFGSPLYGALFGDPLSERVFSEPQEIARMIAVERALARVEGVAGVIPKEAAEAIDAALDGYVVAPEDLASGTASAGVSVPALVSVLRAAVPAEHGTWLHWGATSQDIVDTAQMLALQEAGGLISTRLGLLIDTLEAKAEAYAATPMAGRTRGQIATPISFGLRVANWAAPLIETAAPPLARIQFGGASGANTAIAPHGSVVARALAAELGLEAGPPWHSNRRPIAVQADWYAAVAAGLAKMAEDMIVMMRSEIAEIRAGTGGGSSTMPQKSNPVEAEAIATLAHLVQTARAGLGVPHREERDGAAWAVEWALLPQIVIATGAALRHAQVLAETLNADANRMRATLDATPGVMAEAASFALARQIPRAEATALVKAALSDDLPLAEALAARAPGMDWEEILSPDEAVAPCRDLIAEIFAQRR